MKIERVNLGRRAGYDCDLCGKLMTVAYNIVPDVNSDISGLSLHKRCMTRLRTMIDSYLRVA